jgi:hypothetical protein
MDSPHPAQFRQPFGQALTQVAPDVVHQRPTRRIRVMLLATAFKLDRFRQTAKRPGALRCRGVRCEERDQTSIFAALNAFVSMKSLLGSTSSPISIVNTRSASIASSI